MLSKEYTGGNLLSIFATLALSVHGESPADYSKFDETDSYTQIVEMKALPGSNLVYCVEEDDHQLLEFNTDLGTFTRSIPIYNKRFKPKANEPLLPDDYQIHFSDDNSLIYVNNTTQKVIEVYSLPNLTLLKTWDHFERPIRIKGFDAFENIVLQTANANQIYFADVNTGFVHQHYHTVDKRPREFFIHPNGKEIYGFFSDTFTETLAKWSWDGETLSLDEELLDTKFNTTDHIGIDWDSSTLYFQNPGGPFAYNWDSKSLVEHFEYIDPIFDRISPPWKFTNLESRNELLLSWDPGFFPLDFAFVDSQTGALLRSYNTEKRAPAIHTALTGNGCVLYYIPRWTGAFALDIPRLGIWGREKIFGEALNGQKLVVENWSILEAEGGNKDDFPNPGETFNCSLELSRFGDFVGRSEVTISSSDPRYEIANLDTFTFDEGDRSIEIRDLLLTVPSNALDNEKVDIIFRLKESPETIENVTLTVADPSSVLSPYNGPEIIPLGETMDAVADHTRERFYLTINNKNLVHAIDASTGAILHSKHLFSRYEAESGYQIEDGKLRVSPDGAFLFYHRQFDDKIQRFSLPNLDPAGVLHTRSPIDDFIVAPNNDIYISSVRDFENIPLYRVDFDSGLVIGAAVANDVILGGKLNQSDDGTIVAAYHQTFFYVFEWDTERSNYYQKYEYFNDYGFEGEHSSSTVVDSEKMMLYSTSRFPKQSISSTATLQAIDLRNGEQISQKLAHYPRWNGNIQFQPMHIDLDISTNSIVCSAFYPFGETIDSIVYIDRDTLDIKKRVRYPNDFPSSVFNICSTESGRILINRHNPIFVNCIAPDAIPNGYTDDPVSVIKNDPLVTINETIELDIETLRSHGFEDLPGVELPDLLYEISIVESPTHSIDPVVTGETITFKSEGEYLIELQVSSGPNTSWDRQKFYAYGSSPIMELNPIRSSANLYEGENVSFSIALDRSSPFRIPFQHTGTRAWDLPKLWFEPNETIKTYSVDWIDYSEYFPFSNEGKTEQIQLVQQYPYELQEEASELTFTFIYPPNDNFQLWMAHFTDDNETIHEIDSDYDEDGFSNFHEFIKGTDPTKVGSAPRATFRYELVDNVYYPVIESEDFSTHNNQFRLNYRLEYSHDLATWRYPEQEPRRLIPNLDGFDHTISSARRVLHPVTKTEPIFFRVLLKPPDY